MPSITDKRIFTKEWSEEHQYWFFVVDPSITIAKRREMTRYVAETLQQPRLLTFAELESCLFFEPEPNTVYWFKFPEGRRHPALFVFTEEWLHRHGLLEEFNRLQELLLLETYQQFLVQICGNGKKAYQYGVSFQPAGGPQRAQLTKTARKEEKISGAEINYRLLDFCNKVAAIGLPELASPARRHDNLKHASLIPGPKGRIVFSNQQQNFASLGTNLADEIGKFGDPHPDSDDDITSMTFMLNMSNLPTKVHKGKVVNEFHGGRFVVPAFKAAIPMRPRSVVGFSATFLHFALSILKYAVPENSPMRLPPSLPHLPPSLVPRDDGIQYSFVRCTIPVYTDVKMKYPNFGQFNVEIFTRKAGLALFNDLEGHQDWMTNFFMVFEEMISRYIILYYNDHDDNLFGMGPKILIAALSAYFAEWYKESIAHKNQNLTRDGKAKTYNDRAKQRTRTEAKTQQDAAVVAANEANVTLVPNPPSTEDLPQTKPQDRQFRRSEFYANLFEWIDENGQKHTPALHLIDEIKWAIVSPNPELDQLKQDLETLSCGKKFLNKIGGASAKWVEYETNWEIAEEGISGNPDWTKESLRGVELEDLVHEAEDIFSARKINAIREQERQRDDDDEDESDEDDELEEESDEDEDEDVEMEG